MNKLVENGAKVLAAVGAINWGLAEYVNFNLLDVLNGFMPIARTIGVIAITASGAYVGYLVIKKKI